MLEWLKQRSMRVVVAVIVIVLVAGLAVSFPPDFALLMAVDLSTWVEAAISVYIATQLTRVRPAAAFIRMKLSGRVRKSQRRTRVRSVSRTSDAANDEDPAPELRFVA